MGKLLDFPTLIARFVLLCEGNASPPFTLVSWWRTTLTCINVWAAAFISTNRGAALRSGRRLLSWIVRHSSSAATDGLITSNVLSQAPLVHELIDDFEVRIKPKSKIATFILGEITLLQRIGGCGSLCAVRNPVDSLHQRPSARQRDHCFA